MGIVNVTPDSFFDGGRYLDSAAAVDHARALVAEGADIVDVGGESTRPGATAVPLEEEMRRVLPVVEALAGQVRLSIDTTKAQVAKACLEAGASLLNDVSSTLAETAAACGAGYIAMHRQGSPRDMQRAPHYDDVVKEVFAFLGTAASRAKSLGVDEVYVDPGIGFGKTVRHNLELLAALADLAAAGTPVLVGTSRKSFLGHLGAGGAIDGHLGDVEPLAPEDRFEGSLATAVWAMSAGVAILRVHDVKATAHAARLVAEAAA